MEVSTCAVTVYEFMCDVYIVIIMILEVTSWNDYDDDYNNDDDIIIMGAIIMIIIEGGQVHVYGIWKYQVELKVIWQVNIQRITTFVAWILINIALIYICIYIYIYI